MTAPFSNSTEWDMWSGRWCDRCRRDAPYREGVSQEGCPLILTALSGEVPERWSPHQGEIWRCLDFVHEADPVPAAPVAQVPGQLVLPGT